MLFHITTRTAWQHAVGVGEYTPPTFASEGFIHLSTEEQWPRTHARFFSETSDLVLLVIDPDRCLEIRWEAADGDSFPHLYEVLLVSAVVEVREL